MDDEGDYTSVWDYALEEIVKKEWFAGATLRVFVTIMNTEFQQEKRASSVQRGKYVRRDFVWKGETYALILSHRSSSPSSSVRGNSTRIVTLASDPYIIVFPVGLRGRSSSTKMASAEGRPARTRSWTEG